jgi:hypothetical protein
MGGGGLETNQTTAKKYGLLLSLLVFTLISYEYTELKYSFFLCPACKLAMRK